MSSFEKMKQTVATMHHPDGKPVAGAEVKPVDKRGFAAAVTTLLGMAPAERKTETPSKTTVGV